MFEIRKSDKYLTRLETADLLKVTLPTLHTWTKKGYLQAYRIGERNVYYKLDEVLSAFKEIDYSDFQNENPEDSPN
ncbi:MAG: helix-turn-helix domain-containing protein [Bacteroidetes bacterium]|jgi:excisionase family DNA binding protein|nr:helix-turn-helix domain-containing protein [Bacteroidota bacterium]